MRSVDDPGLGITVAVKVLSADSAQLAAARASGPSAVVDVPPTRATHYEVVQGSRPGVEIDVSTSGSVEDTWGCFEECTWHFGLS